MRRLRCAAAVIGLSLVALLGCGEGTPKEPAALLVLPEPHRTGSVSVEEALATRRSVRSYRAEPLTLAEVGQLLWAAQGITGPWGRRTAPSAGATYPLSVYVVVGAVEGLPPGVYRYVPEDHALLLGKAGDRRAELAHAALGQAWVEEAPVVLAIAARYERTTARYGDRGFRYVHIEVGHVGQNVYLQAQALGLGTVAVGAFVDAAVQAVLGILEEPLLLMPVGRPR